MARLGSTLYHDQPGRFFDGKQAKPWNVLLRFAANNMLIVRADNPSDILAIWPCDEVRLDTTFGPQTDETILCRTDDLESHLQLDDAVDLPTLRARFPNVSARTKFDTQSAKKTLIYIGVAVASVIGLFTVLIPYGASRVAEFIPESYAQEMGDGVIKNLASGFGDKNRLCSTASTDQGLDQVMDQLARAMDIPEERPLRLVVIDSPMKNAIALPGGRMVLFRGLIDLAENGDQLGGVIAHELAHVKYRDPLRGSLQTGANGIIIGLLIGDVTGGAVLGIVAEAALNSSYSRDAELRADDEARAALEYLGADPRHLGQLLRLLTEATGEIPKWMEMFSTHPELKDRMTGEPDPNRSAYAVISEGLFQSLKTVCDGPSAE